MSTADSGQRDSVAAVLCLCPAAGATLTPLTAQHAGRPPATNCADEAIRRRRVALSRLPAACCPMTSNTLREMALVHKRTPHLGTCG